MSTDDDALFVPSRLSVVLEEMILQPQLFSPGYLSFDEEMAQIREYIAVDEYELAYESIIADLKSYMFRLSGNAVVALVEVALVIGKSDG